MRRRRKRRSPRRLKRRHDSLQKGPSQHFSLASSLNYKRMCAEHDKASRASCEKRTQTRIKEIEYEVKKYAVFQLFYRPFSPVSHFTSVNFVNSRCPVSYEHMQVSPTNERMLGVGGANERVIRGGGADGEVSCCLHFSDTLTMKLLL
ncbi:unnamed protein product [Trifolium pratense]|uniref:Uncharacterized protein n=1 Tax=Trifolium pratense TaxID=57577 RepID=A0ACB0LYY5_TRIPR|nr:unnamed protein product [Trifolium pratense]